MDDTKILLQVEHLKKYFSVKDPLSKRIIGHVKAVDNVSFEIREGEILALVGESGCGKSTTGYTILQLEKASEGKIYFQGKDLTSLNKPDMKQMRKQIQMIFQDSHSSLNPHMTVRDIIGEPLEIYRVPKNERIQRITRLLELVGLTQEQGARYPHEFSGGQRQRIGIARALALMPKLIIADEPVSALDVSVQAQIINLLMKLQRELHLSYLFITHDLSVANHISNRVAVMYLGEIIEIGEKDALFSHPMHPYTQALLQAVPIPDPLAAIRTDQIIGDVPSPLNPPSGCRYHTRCPKAMACCGQEAPPQTQAGKDHMVRCHLYKETESTKHGKENKSYEKTQIDS